MEESSSTTTRAEQVDAVLKRVYVEISGGGVKSSVADFIKLIQVSGELTPDNREQVTVEWVETIDLEPEDA